MDVFLSLWWLVGCVDGCVGRSVVLAGFTDECVGRWVVFGWKYGRICW